MATRKSGSRGNSGTKRGSASTSGQNGIVKGIGALMLAAVLATGICCTGFASRDENGKWFGNKNPSTWHWKDKQTEKLPDEGDEENAAFVQDTQEHGVRLMSMAVPYAAGSSYKSSYKLTATVLPDDADNKFGDWSYSWQNPESEWASGKNVKDYFSVTFTRSVWIEDDNMPAGGYQGTEQKDVSESDGSYLEVTASVKMAFSEPIVLTFTSRDDSSKYACKTFGYIKRVDESSMNVVLKKNETATDTLVLGDDQTYTIEFTYTLSDGTVAPDITLQTTFGFEAYAMDFGDGLVDNYGIEYVLANNSFVSTADFYNNCFTQNVTIHQIKEHVAKFGSSAAAHVRVGVTISSNLTTNLYKTSLSKTLGVKVDASQLIIPVSSVTIDGDDVIYS